MSLSLFGHTLLVQWDDSQPWGDRTAGSIHGRGESPAISYTAIPGGSSVFLVDQELIVDGESYGEVPAGAAVEINTIPKTREGGELVVRVAGEERAGKKTPTSGYRINREESSLEGMVGENRVKVNNWVTTVYRVGDDHLWSPPGLLVEIKDGILLYNGASYGEVGPGDRVDIDGSDVLVNYERRESR